MVKSTKYIPERGDIVWLDFNPQLGHEQRGRRPALVMSYKAYNEKIGLAIFCPITSKDKGYPALRYFMWVDAPFCLQPYKS